MPDEKPSIHSPADAANLVMYEMSALPQEHLRVINLHNHPSGDPSPSPEDVALTRTIVQAGKLLDMEVTQMTNVGVSFHASIWLDTLPEDDLARALFAHAEASIYINRASPKKAHKRVSPRYLYLSRAEESQSQRSIL